MSNKFYVVLQAVSENTRVVTREPSKTELEPYEEAEIKREISELAHPPTQVQKSPKIKVKRYEIATVLANYQPSGGGQLLLTRGQIVTVKKKSPTGWWEGELQVRHFFVFFVILCM